METSELLKILKEMEQEHAPRLDPDDRNASYDYNEVQEVFFDPCENYYVILAGKTGLGKKDMVLRVRDELVSGGRSTDSILYLDYELPFLRGVDPMSLFPETGVPDYLLINEIEMIGDWTGFISSLRAGYPRVKLFASSSVPPAVYEQTYELGLDFCKVIVLSEKNSSNIKSVTQSFGTYDEFKYNIKNGIVEIKGLTKTGKKRSAHHVPSSICGKPVRIIASGAFHDRREMESITIPDSVTMIGDYAFTKCTSLESIELPRSVRFIGDHTFFGDTGLKEISGGEGIAHIGNSALYGTKWLSDSGEFAVLGSVLYRYRGNAEAVEIPENVRTLAPYSFAGTDVVSVSSHHEVRMEEGTFYGCARLRNAAIPADTVPSFCFAGCSSLRCSVSSGKVGKFAFYDSGAESVRADEVGACAFAFCRNLASARVTHSAGTGAFWGCANLKDADLREAEKIGSFAVSRTPMKSVCVNRAALSDFAFAFNPGLEDASFIGCASVGKHVLYGCPNVTSMEVGGGVKVSAYFDGNVPGLRKLSVEGDICDDFCRDCGTLEELRIADVGDFGRWAFYKNTRLRKVEMENVARIGEWAFAYCEMLESVVLPESVGYVGMNGFRYCRNLSSITVESRELLPFGPNAFYSTSPEKKIRIRKDLRSDYEKSDLWSDYRPSIDFCL